MNLRHYQKKAIAAVRSLIKAGKRRIVVVSMTGSGKTVIFTHGMIKPAQEKGKRCLVLVHRRELIEQTLEKLNACGVDASVIMSDDPRYNPECTVQVAMLETLIARNHWPTAELVIVDECHHSASDNTWSTFQNHYRKSFIVGFTATPATSGGHPLTGFDAIVVASTYKQLIADGHLVPCEVFAPITSRRLTGAVGMDPAEAFHEYSKGRPGLVFLQTVEECDSCNQNLLKFGYRSGAVVGERPEERDRNIKAFKDGELDVLCSVACLTEGFDAPRAKVAVSGRGLSTPATMIQLVGRILRPEGESKVATFVDLSAATVEHGHPCDDREYSLEPNSVPIMPKSTLQSLWQCKSCFWVDVVRPVDGICPFCGDRIPSTATLKLKPKAFAKVVAWTCPDCGMVHYHTPLTCSQCGSVTPRLQRALTEPDEIRLQYLIKLVDRARMSGWNIWSARHRYRAKYGCLPTNQQWEEACRRTHPKLE
jgi:superfamily II DNA or RNA helicase